MAAPVAGAQIIPVIVGGPQDTFIPNTVQANPGDIIQFQFSNGNHTVTQSTMEQACTPLQLTDPAAIHSGHVPFEDGQEMVGTFNMVVQNAEPIFMYCATGPHCQEGQVMIVNPANPQQIVQYAQLSMAAAENIDGGVASGGIVGQIPLANAAFTPAPPEEVSQMPLGVQMSLLSLD